MLLLPDLHSKASHSKNVLLAISAKRFGGFARDLRNSDTIEMQRQMLWPMLFLNVFRPGRQDIVLHSSIQVCEARAVWIFLARVWSSKTIVLCCQQ